MEEFELCRIKNENVDLHEYAELKEDGSFSIHGEDFGTTASEVFDTDDYEYWYSFTAEEAGCLVRSFDGMDLKTILKENFSGIEGDRKLTKYCDEHHIHYTFHSEIS